MLVLNISGHAVTPGVRDRLDALLGGRCEVRELSRMLDLGALESDVTTVIEDAVVTPQQWQEGEVWVMPPTLGIAAAAVCAYLHGLTGAFPRMVWLRRDAVTGAFIHPEILDLSRIRDSGRSRRFAEPHVGNDRPIPAETAQGSIPPPAVEAR